MDEVEEMLEGWVDSDFIDLKTLQKKVAAKVKSDCKRMKNNV